MNLANIGKKHLRLTLGSIVLVLLLSSVASLGAIWTAPKAFAANPAEWCEKAYGGVTSLVSQCTAGEIDLDLKAVGQLYCSENYSSNSDNLRGCQESVEKYFSMSANSRSNSNRDEFCGGNGTGQLGMTTGSSISCAASWSYLQTVEADVAAWQLRDQIVNGGGIGENPDDTGVASSIKREDECVAAGFEWVDGACTNPAGDEEGSSCVISGVGWIVCPVVNFLAGLTDSAYEFLAERFLSVNIGIIDPNSKTHEAWSTFLGFGNAILIVAFIVVIYSQVSGIGISNYGVKKMIPRIIVMAILINLSFFICQLAVDLSNIVGYNVKLFLSSLVSADAASTGYGSQANFWSAAAIAILAGAGAAGGVAAAGGATLALITLIVMLISAFIALVMIFFILTVRQVLIVLLIVLAPVAFAAAILPNTEPLFKKWRKLFTSMLLLFPIVGLIFGASTLASNILSGTYAADGDTENWFGQIVAAGIMILPLFVVPSVLKKSLDAVSGGLGGKLSGFGSKLSGGLRKRANESAFNKHLQAERATRNKATSIGTYSGRNPVRRLRSNMNRRLNNSGAFNAITEGFGAQRDLAAKAEDRKNLQEIAGAFNSDDGLMTAWIEDGGEQGAAYKALSGTQKTQFDKMRQAGYHRNAQSFLAASQSLADSGKGNAANLRSALSAAKKAGASNTDIENAWQSARSTYKKTGRGDIVGEMDSVWNAYGQQAHNSLNQTAVDDLNNGLTPGTIRAARASGWSTVEPGAVSKDALKSADGLASYQSYLDQNEQHVIDALKGYDRMSGEAKTLAAQSIQDSAGKYSGTTFKTVREAQLRYKIN